MGKRESSSRIYRGTIEMMCEKLSSSILRICNRVLAAREGDGRTHGFAIVAAFMYEGISLPSSVICLSDSYPLPYVPLSFSSPNLCICVGWELDLLGPVLCGGAADVTAVLLQGLLPRAPVLQPAVRLRWIFSMAFDGSTGLLPHRSTSGTDQIRNVP